MPDIPNTEAAPGAEEIEAVMAVLYRMTLGTRDQYWMHEVATAALTAAYAIRDAKLERYREALREILALHPTEWPFRLHPIARRGLEEQSDE